jgi:hypothetical protein
MRKLISRPILIFLLAVALQGVWRFVLGPVAQSTLGESLGNFFFVLFRVMVILALPLVLAWGCGLVRFQALAMTALATFIESVGFTLLQIWREPAGPQVGLGPVLMGLMTAYMFNLPIVLLFAVGGYELGRRLSPIRGD